MHFPGLILKKARIFIAEDEVVVARDLRELVVELGYEPAGQTALGEEAVTLAGELRPDLVLMDIHLAGEMDGIDAARIIRERWKIPSVFLTAFADHRDIRNLYGPDGQTLNAEASLAQYDRLRQQGLAGSLSPEALEAAPVFASGTINTAGVMFERIAGDRWSWSANYIHSQTFNVPYPLAPLPYFPKHRLGLGASWFAPDRWVIRAQLARRSERFADATGNVRLEPDWDVSLRATWQDTAKRSLFEVYGNNLARSDNTRTLGVRAVWRF